MPKEVLDLLKQFDKWPTPYIVAILVVFGLDSLWEWDGRYGYVRIPILCAASILTGRLGQSLRGKWLKRKNAPEPSVGIGDVSLPDEPLYAFTAPERKFLKWYIKGDTETGYLDIYSHPVVFDLLRKGALILLSDAPYRNSFVKIGLTEEPCFTIDDAVWKYLKDNPGVLKSAHSCFSLRWSGQIPRP